MAATDSDPDPNWLSRPVERTTRVVLRAPRWTLTLGLVFAGLAIWLAASSLQFKTNRLDLLNPDSGFQKRWLAYLEEFGDQDDVVVVVEGSEPETIKAAMHELATLLRDEEWFEGVLERRDLTPLREKALHFLTVEQLQELNHFLVEFAPLLEGDWSQLELLQILQRANDHLESWSVDTHADPSGDARLARAVNEQKKGMTSRTAEYLGTTPSAFATPDTVALATQALRGTMRAFTHSLRDPQTYVSPWPSSFAALSDAGSRFETHWQLDANARTGFVILQFGRREGSFVNYGPPLVRLREIVADVQRHYPQLRLGVTGLPVLENDEMQASQSDSTWTSLWSLIGVALIFVAGFGCFRRPLLAVAALLIALTWSFGYVTLAVGHVNILSASFGVILIGLGIDFGIHYITSYGQLMADGLPRTEALAEAARQVGPGILTGGLTTALSFCTTVLTDFTGIAELGLIAAGGILLCILASLTVLPAMLAIWDAEPRSARPVQPLSSMVPSALWLRRPVITLVLFLLVTGVIAAGMTRLKYDHNLLNLQPQGLESAELSRRLAQDQERDVWFAVAQFNSREELLRAKSQLAQLDVVGSTEELVTLLPPGEPKRNELIRNIQARLRALPEQPPLIPVASRGQLSAEVQRLSALTGNVDPLVAELAQALDQLAVHDYFRRVSQFQQRAATELLGCLQQIATMADPHPPQPTDLPPALTKRFLGRHGRHLLRIYARGEIWDMDALSQFVKRVEQIVPHVTGHPIQTYYASRQMQQSYLHAAIYSLIAVCIVLILDFRSIRHSLLALVPMLFGLMQMLGLLGWLGIPLNPANMIVLPLILGIGIDDGVHILHDFVRHSGPYRLAHSTAAAIVFTSATTMVGFGCLMFATHQGLRSLGQVMTLGILCCLASSLFSLPCLLTIWRTGFSGAADSDKVTDSGCLSLPPQEPETHPRTAAA